MSAVYQQQGLYQQAHQCANQALIESQNQLIEVINNPGLKLNEKLMREKVKYVGMSFHSLGVQEENQQNYDRALDYYKKGQEIIIQYVGEQDSVFKKIQQSFVNLKMKLE